MGSSSRRGGVVAINTVGEITTVNQGAQEILGPLAVGDPLSSLQPTIERVLRKTLLTRASVEALNMLDLAALLTQCALAREESRGGHYRTDFVDNTRRFRKHSLLRKGEEAYREMGLADPDLGDDALVDAMVRAPRLIERPVVVRGDRAVLGRPPENVLELVD